MECIKTIFFCCNWQNENQQQRNSQRRITRQSDPRTPKKKPSQSRPKRLITKFRPDQVTVISDQERKAGVKPIYACPLCFQYYNKILACSQCSNFICLNCFIQYENKSRKRKQLMKCAFCYSTSSDFADHQKQGHSYWDTTNKGNGFLSKEQREQVDKQLKKSGNKSAFKVEQANLAQIQQQNNDNDHQNEESLQNIIGRQPFEQQNLELNRNQDEPNEQQERQDPFANIQVRSEFDNQQSHRAQNNNQSIIQMESLNIRSNAEHIQ